MGRKIYSQYFIEREDATSSTSASASASSTRLPSAAGSSTSSRSATPQTYAQVVSRPVSPTLSARSSSLTSGPGTALTNVPVKWVDDPFDPDRDSDDAVYEAFVDVEDHGGSGRASRRRYIGSPGTGSSRSSTLAQEDVEQGHLPSQRTGAETVTYNSRSVDVGSGRGEVTNALERLRNLEGNLRGQTSLSGWLVDQVSREARRESLEVLEDRVRSDARALLSRMAPSSSSTGTGTVPTSSAVSPSPAAQAIRTSTSDDEALYVLPPRRSGVSADDPRDGAGLQGAGGSQGERAGEERGREESVTPSSAVYQPIPSATPVQISSSAGQNDPPTPSSSTSTANDPFTSIDVNSSSTPQPPVDGQSPPAAPISTENGIMVTTSTSIGVEPIRRLTSIAPTTTNTAVRPAHETFVPPRLAVIHHGHGSTFHSSAADGSTLRSQARVRRIPSANVVVSGSRAVPMPVTSASHAREMNGSGAGDGGGVGVGGTSCDS